MEKIPYKPGDVLGSDKNYEVTVVDLSQNGYVAFLSYIYPARKDPGISFQATKEILDDMGYKLKTPAKWVPVNKEKYFYIDDSAHVNYTHWDNGRSDDFRLKNNNVFQTEEEAMQAYVKIMNS